MRMEWVPVLLSLSGGFGAGLLYFGGLWWSVKRLARVKRPALLSLISFLLRAAFVLAVFYLLGQGRWERIAACLAGFLLARVLLLGALAPGKGRAGVPSAKVRG